MDNHYKPRSKGTWGREEAKSSEELNRLCNEFFEKLVVPPEWKFLGWSNAVDNDTGFIYSVGKAYRDMRTRNLDLKDYRVYFNSFSTRGGICEKSMVDFGKYAKKSIVANKTVEKLNEWIAERYNELTDPLNPPNGGLKDQLHDENDGLQHFRDRFGDRVVDSAK